MAKECRRPAKVRRRPEAGDSGDGVEVAATEDGAEGMEATEEEVRRRCRRRARAGTTSRRGNMSPFRLPAAKATKGTAVRPKSWRRIRAMR